jgi:hypothetical protein
MMLTANITGIEVIFMLDFVIIDCNNPVCQTLSIKMNIEAKKINVRQSIFLMIASLFWLNKITGKDANSAMYVRLKSIFRFKSTIAILAVTRIMIKTKEILERFASLRSFM